MINHRGIGPNCWYDAGGGVARRVHITTRVDTVERLRHTSFASLKQSKPEF